MSPPKINLDELVRQIREQEAQFDKEHGGDPQDLSGITPESDPSTKIESSPAAPGAQPVKPLPAEKEEKEKAPRGPFWTRRTKAFAIWLVLLGVLGLALLPQIRRSMQVRAATSGDPAVVNLDIPMLQMFGALDGPYAVAEVLGPNHLRLSGAGGRTLECTLLGLAAEPYPVQKDPALSDAPADPQEIKDYLAQVMKDALGNRAYWLLHMGPGDPAPVYLFHPQNDVEPHGNADFMNAALLSKGYALFSLAQPTQPLFASMAAAQRQALAGFDARTAAGDSVWYHYPMAFPRNQLPADDKAAAASRR